MRGSGSDCKNEQLIVWMKSKETKAILYWPFIDTLHYRCTVLENCDPRVLTDLVILKLHDKTDN